MMNSTRGHSQSSACQPEDEVIAGILYILPSAQGARATRVKPEQYQRMGSSKLCWGVFLLPLLCSPGENGENKLLN